MKAKNTYKELDKLISVLDLKISYVKIKGVKKYDVNNRKI